MPTGEGGSVRFEDLGLPPEPTRARKPAPAPRKGRRGYGRLSLVALYIVTIIFGVAMLYLQSWPPTLVVESNSMQHGPGDHLGDINAGDVVLIHHVPASGVVTYAQGIRSGYRTYGEPGNVLIYYPDGSVSATPIVHRAIVYLAWEGHGTYNATELGDLECSNNSSSPSYYVTSSVAGPGKLNPCADTDLGSSDTLDFYHVGKISPIPMELGSPSLGNHSGFLTLGDNNTAFDQTPSPNYTLGYSSLVEPSWIVGVAVGLVPWVGAIELAMVGHAGNVSPASWRHLEESAVVVLVAGLGVFAVVRGVRHGLRRRAAERRRRSQYLDDVLGSPLSAPRTAGSGPPPRPGSGAPAPVGATPARGAAVGPTGGPPYVPKPQGPPPSGARAVPWAPVREYDARAREKWHQSHFGTRRERQGRRPPRNDA